MSVTGTGPGDPTKVGVALVDVLAGLHALSGILVALAHRDRTGEGQRVDTDLLSVLLSSMVNQASGYLGAGAVPGHHGQPPPQHRAISDRSPPPTVPSRVAVGNDKQFTAAGRGDRICHGWPTTPGSRPTRNGSHNRDALVRHCSARS